MKHKQLPNRQGDILLIPIESVPEGATPVALENGRYVLAHGEVTGHAHVIATPDGCELVTAEGADDLYLIVHGDAPELDAVECTNAAGDTVYIPAGYDPALYRPPLTPIRELRMRGAVVEHDEHQAFVQLPGSHEVRRQVEYTPEEIRRVED